MLLAQYKQAVRCADERSVRALLVESQVPSLAAWYGNPVAQPAAEALCARAQRALQSRRFSGGACFPLHLLQLICHFWMGVSTRLDYVQLGVLARTDRDAALLQLCYGQLLISRKLRPAMQCLAQGFSQAVPYLEPAEYFALVRQHECLASLRLTDTPARPCALQNLLAEAAVIGRLQHGDRGQQRSTHLDTVG